MAEPTRKHGFDRTSVSRQDELILGRTPRMVTVGSAPLCARPGCSIRGRHAEDCPGECAGCLPARAADGLRLCPRCADHIGRDARQAADLYDELALRLLGGTGLGDKVTGTPGARLPDPRAVDMRTEIRHVLVGWCRIVSEERGLSLPPDLPPALGEYLTRHAAWLAATPYADEVADELHSLRSRAWSVAYPEGARRVSPGPCPDTVDRESEDFIGPMPRCPGSLTGIMRREDALLPSELICSANPAHRWTADQWRTLGKQIDPDKVRWRYMTAVEIAEHWDLPLGTVWRYASLDQWRRSADGRRPALYLIDDVVATIDRRVSVAA
jgi:hypothetical protein